MPVIKLETWIPEHEARIIHPEDLVREYHSVSPESSPGFTWDEDVRARGEARDLFAALAVARRELEAQGVQLACNGARLDVWPSGMLRQASYGRRVYVLTMPPTAAEPSMVDIFEPTPKSSALATVDEQREWFRRYWDSRTRKGGS
jgi:hypothetical protein